MWQKHHRSRDSSVTEQASITEWRGMLLRVPQENDSTSQTANDKCETKHTELRALQHVSEMTQKQRLLRDESHGMKEAHRDAVEGSLRE